MASELGNQLLVRVQEEMARNISTIKKQLVEWLERPESGGTEPLCTGLTEISGGLSLLGQNNAAELSDAIRNGIVYLNTEIVPQGKVAAASFAADGAELASGLLVLADYIERLDNKNNISTQSLQQVTIAVNAICDNKGNIENINRVHVRSQPFIHKDTYQALADKVKEVFDSGRNQIEQYISNPGKSLNIELLTEQNNELISMFDVLNLKAPQLLLQHVNHTLAEQLTLSQWIEIAEAMILVGESLKQIEKDSDIDGNINSYEDAITHQTRHSRLLEVRGLIADTGLVGKQFFETLRKTVVDNTNLDIGNDRWQEAIQQLASYSNIIELVKLKNLAKQLRRLGVVYTEISVSDKALSAQVYALVVDTLVAVEYLFNDLSLSSVVSAQDVGFLSTSIDGIVHELPITKQAQSLFRNLVSQSLESDDITEDNSDTLSISQFDDALSSGLDALDNDFSTLDFEHHDDDEETTEEEQEITNVSIVSAIAGEHTAKATSSIAVTQGQSTDNIPGEGAANQPPLSTPSQQESAPTAFFAGKSLSDLDQLSVPEAKVSFTTSHADAVMDDEIREFFTEELEEIIQSMEDVYPKWCDNPTDPQLTNDIRRAFHTLKGSGRTVGYESLGEFAWQHEQLLNRVIDKDYAANSLVRDTVGDAIDLLKILEQQEEFSEHQGALLQQALVAENARNALLESPDSNQQKLNQLSRQLRLSAANATGSADTNQDIQGESAAGSDIPSAKGNSADSNSEETQELSHADLPQGMTAGDYDRIAATLKSQGIPEAGDSAGRAALASSLAGQWEEQASLQDETVRASVAQNNQSSLSEEENIEIFTEQNISASENQIEAEGELAEDTVNVIDIPVPNVTGANPVVGGNSNRQNNSLVGGYSDNTSVFSGASPMENTGHIPVPAINPVERLNQELQSLSQHQGLTDSLQGANRASTTERQAVFLRAVDQFETLSQLAEKDSSPETVDDLINSVYDIEDSIDPDAAPPWIWRLLDSIEQLLLMYKHQGLPVTLSCAEILRHSAGLIEHYNEDDSEDEAMDAINSLMNARKNDRSHLPPPNVSAPAVAVPPQVSTGGENIPVAPATQTDGQPYSTELLWGEMFPDPNAHSVLAETFIDEAMSLFAHSQEEAERWDENREQLGRLDSIRRDMHTLKGSARMAGYMAIGDLTHAVESLIDAIVDGNAEAGNKAAAILVGAMWQGMLMLDTVRDGYLPQTDPYILNNIHDYLNLPLPYPEIAEATAASKMAAAQKEDKQVSDAQFRDVPGDGNVTAETVGNNSIPVNLNTTTAADNEVAADSNDTAATASESDASVADIDIVETDVSEVSETDDLTSATDAAEFDPNIDPILVDIFTDEAQELLETTSQLLDDDFGNHAVIEELQRTMHTLKGGARLVGFTAIGDTAHLMESVIDKVPELAESKVRQAKSLLNLGLDAHYDMLDSVMRHEMPRPATELNESLKTFAESGRYVLPQEQAEQQSSSDDISETGDNASAESTASEAQPEMTPPLAENVHSAGVQAKTTSDAEVSPAKQESTGKRDTAAESSVAETNGHREEASHADKTVKRDEVHGNHSVAKAAEKSAEHSGAESITPRRVEETSEVSSVSDISSEKDGKTPKETTDIADKFADNESATDISQLADAVKDKKSAEISDNKNVAKAKETSVQSGDLPRYVRVDAHLLDEMIAMVGETAIMRSRMENITAEAEFNLNELTRVVTRISEQMRRLDSETEAQMLYRREQQGDDDEHFDPLEMDRFSEIQQLSRQLSEAIDDLKNLQETLSDDNSVLRNISNQQGIVQRNIQDRLLTTQLMRFDVHEPRLRRLVKQTAKSVGKEVNFILEGGEVELERRLLEDILPALEHMIRNSLAHGIEKPAERVAAGKPETGIIKLIVEAHAAELSVRLIDDGQGLNYDRIREKAAAKGLLDPARADDEAYLSSLILRSGFSTAESLSQLSGRGVGMDVVNEMVKQRRGQIFAHSIRGKGTEFTLKMPFSMSIAEVLLVEIAGQIFAAPMTSIAAISQVSKEALQRSFSGETVYQRYNDADYHLFVLGAYFRPEEYEFIPEENSYPVLFINAGGEPVAFHVDRILNRLEIIVKNVNRQVLNIPGISGATILGDGRVVPVLELLDLSRRIAGLTPTPESFEEEKEDVAKNILVVDDSVTMRKVSTRLLERNHYNVATAKDGLDAIDVLETFTPDLIMLDIEMPRMDGFEFAAHVRHNSQVPDVPIVMITSRTGDKHRDRADQIGVQGYLGKPYSEEVLIQTLESLLSVGEGK